MRRAASIDVQVVLHRLGLVASTAEVPYPHWLGGDGADQGPSYCRDCASKLVAAGEAEFVDGGWMQDNDGCCLCEECGRLLDYTLTDYGVEEELSHFKSVRLRGAMSPELAYQLSRVLEQHHEHPEVLALLPKTCRALDRSKTPAAHKAMLAAREQAAREDTPAI